jgi:hypothetical protein
MASITRRLTDILPLIFPQSYADQWTPPSPLELALTRPLQYLITTAYHAFNGIHKASRPAEHPITVVCISDTHSLRCNVPDGDLLIHAGDITKSGTPEELQAQIDWLNSLPHTHKVAIAGNHDTWLDPSSRRTLPGKPRAFIDWGSVQYLEHDSASLVFPAPGADRDPAGDTKRRFATPPRRPRSLALYGAPQIPRCGGDDHAFQYGPLLDAWTGTVPERTQVLITHAPPKYHLDLSLGCSYLLREAWRVRPRLHVFGHVHGGAGRETVRWDDVQRVYERAMGRAVGRGIRQLGSLVLWYDLGALAWHGVWGIVWERLWGGRYPETVLVNAATMRQDTNRLGNPPQVVVL